MSHENPASQENRSIQMNEPSFAVIVPVYNSARYLKETLDSLFAQTYKNFTVIAVDDGSTDESLNILQEYEQKNYPIKVLTKPNGGVSSARNFALDYIETEKRFDYVCFVDSDDIVTKDFLAQFADNIKCFNAPYLTCGCQAFDTRGPQNKTFNLHEPIILDQDNIYAHFFSLGQWRNFSSPTSLFFIGNRCYRLSGISELRFHEKLGKGEDKDFMLRAAKVIHSGVVFSNQTYLYRLRKSSLSHSKKQYNQDILLFDSLTKEIEHAENPYLREGTLIRLLNGWWQAVRRCFVENEYSPENWQLLSDRYSAIVKLSGGTELGKKYRQRFFLFKLGPLFLRFYFTLLRKNARGANKQQYYFD